MPLHRTIDGLDFSLDVSARELVRAGGRVRVPEKPFQVLLALVEAEGEAVTRDSLRLRLWSEDTFVDFDNNLNSAVATLRHLLGDSARAPTYIETLPKIGYRLRVPKDTPGVTRGIAPVSSRSRDRFSREYRGLYLVAAFLLALSAAFLAGLHRRGDGATSPSRSDVDEAQSSFERGLYLRGRYFAGREEASLSKALDAFRDAGRLDPDFVRAAAEEAQTWLDMSFFGVVDFRDGFESARAAAAGALALDPANAAGLRVMAMAALFLDWDLAGARRWLERADAAGPEEARTSLSWATLFAASGRHAAAVRAAERAVELDPETYYVRADLAFFYLAAGSAEEAAESCRRVLEVAPDFAPALSLAVLANERLGRWDEAARAARALLTRGGAAVHDLDLDDPRAIVDGWRRRDLERTQSMAAGRVEEFALSLALRHAVIGDRAAALEHLDVAFGRRHALLVLLPSFPELVALRGEPRFELLVRRILWPGSARRSLGR